MKNILERIEEAYGLGSVTLDGITFSQNDTVKIKTNPVAAKTFRVDSVYTKYTIGLVDVTAKDRSRNSYQLTWDTGINIKKQSFFKLEYMHGDIGGQMWISVDKKDISVKKDSGKYLSALVKNVFKELRKKQKKMNIGDAVYVYSNGDVSNIVNKVPNQPNGTLVVDLEDLKSMDDMDLKWELMYFLTKG